MADRSALPSPSILVSDELLRSVFDRLLRLGYGHMSDLLDGGDYRDDIDVNVDGPLKPIIAAVVVVLAEFNTPLYTDRLEGSEQ